MSNATVIRIRRDPPGTDRYGDPDPDAVTTRTTLPGCIAAPAVPAAAPGRTSEILDRGRQGVQAGMALYAPYGTDIVFTDQLEVDGVLYEVDGFPGSWESPWSGWQAGVELALRRHQG